MKNIGLKIILASVEKELVSIWWTIARYLKINFAMPFNRLELGMIFGVLIEKITSVG